MVVPVPLSGRITPTSRSNSMPLSTAKAPPLPTTFPIKKRADTEFNERTLRARKTQLHSQWTLRQPRFVFERCRENKDDLPPFQHVNDCYGRKVPRDGMFEPPSNVKKIKEPMPGSRIVTGPHPEISSMLEVFHSVIRNAKDVIRRTGSLSPEYFLHVQDRVGWCGAILYRRISALAWAMSHSDQIISRYDLERNFLLDLELKMYEEYLPVKQASSL